MHVFTKSKREELIFGAVAVAALASLQPSVMTVSDTLEMKLKYVKMGRYIF